MCDLCDWKASGDGSFSCNECGEPITDPCPDCGGAICLDCDDDCFWCATGLGPAGDQQAPTATLVWEWS